MYNDKGDIENMRLVRVFQRDNKIRDKDVLLYTEQVKLTYRVQMRKYQIYLDMILGLNWVAAKKYRLCCLIGIESAKFCKENKCGRGILCIYSCNLKRHNNYRNLAIMLFLPS